MCRTSCTSRGEGDGRITSTIAASVWGRVLHNGFLAFFFGLYNYYCLGGGKPSRKKEKKRFLILFFLLAASLDLCEIVVVVGVVVQDAQELLKGDAAGARGEHLDGKGVNLVVVEGKPKLLFDHVAEFGLADLAVDGVVRDELELGVEQLATRLVQFEKRPGSVGRRVASTRFAWNSTRSRTLRPSVSEFVRAA